MVPPMADNMSTNFAALSLVTVSIVGASEYILTNRSLFFHSYPYEWKLSKLVDVDQPNLSEQLEILSISCKFCMNPNTFE